MINMSITVKRLHMFKYFTDGFSDRDVMIIAWVTTLAHFHKDGNLCVDIDLLIW